MLKKTRNTACVVACIVALGGMAQAEEVDIQAVLDAAMPHMHHSCASVLETYPDDDDAVAEIVRQMAFVSIYNRQLDILALVPDEAEREGLKDEFVEELEDSCDDDPGKLLAGAVDMAVKNTMAAYD
ncbi:YmgD family protein [Ruegeria arenilitoris]|uniref:YmgD family protein n=1 Tax=Ruegeria arenilitoris TaxID=1173585 RepID=UPI0014814FCE|nr:YmgD family protein [Ruegeria arenilitoris]